MSYIKKIALIVLLGVSLIWTPVFADDTADEEKNTGGNKDAIEQQYVEINSQLNAFGSQFGASTETTTDIRIVVARIIRIVLSLMAVVAVAYVIYGGYLYLTSGGSDERIGKARKIIFYGAIGLAIMLLSFSITSFVYRSIYGAINPWADNGFDIYTQPDNSQYDNPDKIDQDTVPEDYTVDWGSFLDD